MAIREVIFRGKRADNGEWIEGDLLQIKYYNKPIIECKIMPQTPVSSAYPVLSETIGQYTGLTDRNGKKIFEGDIVRLTDEHNEIEWTAVVVFGNPNGEYNWGWQLKAIGEFDGNKDILLWVDMEESGAYCEIIGNIHDNPELLR